MTLRIDNDELANMIAIVGLELYEKAMSRIKEALEMIHQQIGNVKFIGAGRWNSEGIPYGKLISCHIRQKKEGEADFIEPA